jgi:hypothetical protein
VEREGPRGGHYTPFSAQHIPRDGCALFLRRARQARPLIQIVRHLLHIPRDAQALIKKRANRRRPLFGKSEKAKKASLGQVLIWGTTMSRCSVVCPAESPHST